MWFGFVNWKQCSSRTLRIIKNIPKNPLFKGLTVSLLCAQCGFIASDASEVDINVWHNRKGQTHKEDDGTVPKPATSRLALAAQGQREAVWNLIPTGMPPVMMRDGDTWTRKAITRTYTRTHAHVPGPRSRQRIVPPVQRKWNDRIKKISSTLSSVASKGGCVWAGRPPKSCAFYYCFFLFFWTRLL